MKCPHCNHPEDHVIDSRPVETANVIRRRRECLSCAKRFTTYERCETIPVVVIKSDNRREPFDRDKLRAGISLAFKKRPTSADEIEKIVNEIEVELQEEFVLEAPSKVIGKMVIQRLKKLDLVAYIRFVSVYQQFPDVDHFISELQSIKVDKKIKKKREEKQFIAKSNVVMTYSPN